MANVQLQNARQKTVNTSQNLAIEVDCRKQCKKCLIEGSIINVFLFIPILALSMVGTFIEKHSGLKNILEEIATTLLAATPFLMILSIPVGWILYAFKKYKIAKVIIFVPIGIPVVIFSAFAITGYIYSIICLTPICGE